MMIEEEKIKKVVMTHKIHEIRYEIHCERESFSTKAFIEKEPFVILSTSSGFPGQFAFEKEEILRCLSKLKETFNDLQERQIRFTQLKNKLIHLRNKLTLSQKEFLRSINMCIDALENIKAEFMNIKQVDVLEFALKMSDESMDEYMVNELQDILIKSGLKPIPNLDGIAELYKDLDKDLDDDYE